MLRADVTRVLLCHLLKFIPMPPTAHLDCTSAHAHVRAYCLSLSLSPPTHLKVVANLTDPTRCSSVCNSTAVCAGFTWEQGHCIDDKGRAATSLCIPKSATCNHPAAPAMSPIPENKFVFFTKNGAKPPGPRFPGQISGCSDPTSPYSKQKWCDPTVPSEERVSDMISRM